jgi:hypothetical protein
MTRQRIAPEDAAVESNGALVGSEWAKAQIARLQDALEQSNSLSEHASARSRSLVDERDQLQARADAEIARLTHELREANEAAGRVGIEARELGAALQKSEALRALTETRIGDFQISLSEMTHRSTAAQSALDALRLSAAEADSAFQAAQIEILDLKTREAGLQAALATSRASVTELGTREAALQVELAESRAAGAAANAVIHERRDEEVKLRSALEKSEAAMREAQARTGTIERTHGEVRSSLERKLVAQSLCLQQAEATIRSFAVRSPTRWERLGVALRFAPYSRDHDSLIAWSAVKDRIFASWHDQGHDYFQQDSMSHFPEFDGRNPYLRASSLTELLAFDDLDFVRCAYVTLLGRQPDLAGEAHYASEIRAGTSKLEVLWRLRRSAEGKDHDPGISGLDRALNRAAFERRPIVGAVARLLRNNADSKAQGVRALRAIHNAASVNVRQLAAINKRLDDLQGKAAAASSQHHEAVTTAALPARRSPVDVVIADRTPELDHLRSRRVARLKKTPLRD